jgi:hypothetical protein
MLSPSFLLTYTPPHLHPMAAASTENHPKLAPTSTNRDVFPSGLIQCFSKTLKKICQEADIIKRRTCYETNLTNRLGYTD